jgi:hypothetical protein
VFPDPVVVVAGDHIAVADVDADVLEKVPALLSPYTTASPGWTPPTPSARFRG